MRVSAGGIRTSFAASPLFNPNNRYDPDAHRRLPRHSILEEQAVAQPPQPLRAPPPRRSIFTNPALAFGAPLPNQMPSPAPLLDETCVVLSGVPIDMLAHIIVATSAYGRVLAVEAIDANSVKVRFATSDEAHKLIDLQRIFVSGRVVQAVSPDVYAQTRAVCPLPVVAAQPPQQRSFVSWLADFVLRLWR